MFLCIAGVQCLRLHTIQSQGQPVPSHVIQDRPHQTGKTLPSSKWHVANLNTGYPFYVVILQLRKKPVMWPPFLCGQNSLAKGVAT